MAFHNQVILMGNIGKAPEKKTLPDGTEMATFSLAVSMSKKVGDAYEYVTQWHNCKAFGREAERLAKLGKGAKIGVVAEWIIETWEKEGQRHERHVVSVKGFQVITKPISDAQPSSAKEYDFPTHETAPGAAQGEDDLPF